MQTKADKNLQLDYVAFLVGAAVADFCGAKVANNPEDAIAWKLYAARLSQALDELQGQTKGSPPATAKYVDAVVGEAKAQLKQVWDGKEPNQARLEDFLRKNPPPSKTVYKGIDGSEVKGAEPGGK
jgi:hypothetical protein